MLHQSDYSFFHSSHWARVLHESYRYRPLYFIQLDQGKLSVMVPLMEVKSVLTGRRGVGLPFTDYCEPIVLDKQRYHDIVSCLVQFGVKAGWESIEIRTANACTPRFPSASSYSVHTLDLSPGVDTLFKNLRETTRRNIKKSIREGVSVTVHTTPESVTAFYKLNCQTRKEHGLPPQPYYFFKKIHEHILSRNLGFVALAAYGGREIAGAVYFYSRHETIYKYGASLRSMQHLRANNLVMWDAIRWCSEHGYKSLCFGRTELHHTGLRQFKSGWGGEEKIIDYYKYDLKKKAFVEKNGSGTGGIPIAIWKHIPIPLLKIAGRILYRHVG